MKPRSAFLQKLVHFLTAFTLALKGFSKLDHPEGYWPVIILFFASAAYIVVVTLLHDRLHHHERWISASIYALEAVAMAIMAAVYLSEGKRALGTVATLAPIGFTIALIVHLRRTRGGNGPHPPRVRGA
ncbi:MAG TPA: hypothetical protein VE010_11345 [Thermoanaerobaculia bacterium]|nr:hypothetical protein [Thermoanaerobaculia bacterium]